MRRHAFVFPALTFVVTIDKTIEIEIRIHNKIFSKINLVQINKKSQYLM